MGRAEVMAVWVKFRKGVDMTQPCLALTENETKDMSDIVVRMKKVT